MIVGPVRKVETPEGTILVTLDAHDMKYLLWGCYERVSLNELREQGIDLNQAEEIPPAKR